MGKYDGFFDDILSGKTKGAIPENAERSFTGELAAGLKAGVSVELPKMAGQALKATGRPGDALHDIGQRFVSGAERRYNADPAGYAKSAYGSEMSDYNPLKYAYEAGSMTPPSLAGAAAAIPVAIAGAPAAAVAGAGMLASGAQLAIANQCDQLKDTLLEKNRKYGNSALSPVRLFSKADPVEQIRVRIDDKLSRLQSSHLDDTEDTEMDMAGYLVLLKVAKAGIVES